MRVSTIDSPRRAIILAREARSSAQSRSRENQRGREPILRFPASSTPLILPDRLGPTPYYRWKALQENPISN